MLLTTVNENTVVQNEEIKKREIIRAEQFGDLLSTGNSIIKKAFDVGMKFVAKSHARPVLCGVHYDENGTLVATDAHRLIRIENVWIKGCEPFTITVNKKEYGRIEGNYPDTDRIIPDIDNATASVVFSVDNPVLRAVLKLITDGTKDEKNPTLCISYEEGTLTFEPGTANLKEKGLTLSYQLEVYSTSDKPFSIAVSAKYLLETLDAFKKLKIDRVHAHYFSNLRPLLLTAADDDPHNVKAIILPIRVY